MSAATKRYNGDKLPDNILKYIKGGSFEGTNRDYMIKFIEDLHQTGKGGTMLGQAKQLLLDISKCWDRFEVIRTKQMVYMSRMIKCEEIIEILQSNNTSAKQDYLTKLCVQFHDDFRHTCDFREKCDKKIQQTTIEDQQKQLFWNTGKIVDDDPEVCQPSIEMFKENRPREH
ncbi:hypothetical protein GCK72_023389 [Caenorhabditis remanei]|uniref:Uncharacterized protein n=1 Tax=Caenorhabditis remanei TaxID=31234 RepID=A0A6A5FWU7_CAERE|nr:hypothetical protein GCK72_023389 [Caenorhabditis remanei]KAF1746931.1 hypothetical protein GCK72_023389 [Caenorhabditis remanei]